MRCQLERLDYYRLQMILYDPAPAITGVIQDTVILGIQARRGTRCHDALLCGRSGHMATGCTSEAAVDTGHAGGLGLGA